ncbi:MAG TPA: PDZ domain-containing protein, partial [Acidimicrobiales bacterium]|nr:PDZ domain-containing protein [Acidimicrobiales bacterium]
TGGSQGYAIPINTALSIAHQIMSGNASSTVHIGPTALLGVEVSPSRSGAGFGGSSVAGADVVGLLADSPAAQAGIVAGDVITSVDGRTVTSGDTLTTVMASLRPGQTVSVGYTDTSGQSQTTTLKLATGPPQ